MVLNKDRKVVSAVSVCRLKSKKLVHLVHPNKICPSTYSLGFFAYQILVSLRSTSKNM